MPVRSYRSGALTSAARDLAVERGLRSFTVQDVADRAGVSRRTFFNHFASKEHAVLGLSLRVPSDLGEREFLASASTPVTLIDAVGQLLMTRMAAYVGSLDEFEQLQALLLREARLRTVVEELLSSRFQDDVRLVEQWLGASEGDPRAAITVQTVTLLLQRVLQRRMRGGSAGSFESDFTAELTLLRDVVATRGASR